jgi:hypothetical protein
MLEKSFLYVEKLSNSSFFQQSINQSNVELQWDVILVDTDLDTKIKWCRRNHLLGESTVEVQWSISNSTEPGVYRIRHVGSFKVPNLGFKACYISFTKTWCDLFLALLPLLIFFVFYIGYVW